MSQNYKTIREKFARDSFVEKKSEFIASVARVENEDEAKEFIASIKKKHAPNPMTINDKRVISKGVSLRWITGNSPIPKTGRHEV